MGMYFPSVCQPYKHTSERHPVGNEQLYSRITLH